MGQQQTTDATSAPMVSAFEERVEERTRLVESIRRQTGAPPVTDPRVLDAMSRVPRHAFVDEAWQSRAYQDRPLPIGEGQTISQPYIVALMSELLEVGPGARVLEVGTGSGYQAAVLAEMGVQVWSIEIVEPLGRRAAEVLTGLGYAVNLRIGDGYRGWPEAAPFDAIIVTCAPDDVPAPLVEQLRVGGRMVIPTGPAGGAQVLYVLTRGEGGALHEERVLPVQFVPMTGEAQQP